MFGFSEYELEMLGMCLRDAQDDFDQSGSLVERFERRMSGEAHPRLSAPEWSFLAGRVLRLGEREMHRLVVRLREEN